MIAWNHQHGRPPRRRDWPGGGASHPAGNTVYLVFGCRSAALIAAGFDASPPGPPRRPGGWDRDSVIEWTDRFGESPRLVDWSPSLARRHAAARPLTYLRPSVPGARSPRGSFDCSAPGTVCFAPPANRPHKPVCGARLRVPPLRPGRRTAHRGRVRRSSTPSRLTDSSRAGARPPDVRRVGRRRPDRGSAVGRHGFCDLGSWRAAVLAAGLRPRNYTRRQSAR